jgi:RecA-family ATPase
MNMHANVKPTASEPAVVEIESHGRTLSADKGFSEAALAEITGLASANALSKRIALGADGGLAKGPPRHFGVGKAHRLRVGSAKELAAYINGCRPTQAFLYSRLKEGIVDPADVFLKGKETGDAISRSKEFFENTNGPGWVLVDVDRGGAAALASLYAVAPELKTTARVVRASTSSGIYDFDEFKPLSDSDGLHASFLLADQSDGPRFLDDLHKRLWLAGHGWIKVSAAGTMLERSPVDLAMKNPVQPIFEGAPELGPELWQAKREAEAFEGDPLDSRAAVPPLTKVEEKEYAERVQAAKAEKAAEAERVRDKWVEARVEGMVRKGVSAERARAAAEQVADGGLLPPEFQLHFDRFGLATVADVLDDPKVYLLQTLADPIEGIAYGHGKAKLYRTEGKLWINSFAHGGMRYELEGRVEVEDALGGTDAGEKGESRKFAYRAANFKGKPRVERKWLVPDLIPDENVTAVSGNGGDGKSLLLLQLAAAVVLGRNWLGMPVKQGPVVFVSAEDDDGELHNRLCDIAEAEGFDIGDLKDLYIVQRTGKDAVMGLPDKTGVIKPTPLWATVKTLVDQVKAALIILDTRADIYGGDEIDRPQVRQFVGQLRGLAVERQCTVMMAEHPSQNGRNTGTGESGSTAWHNSVKSRLYLTRSEDEDEQDPDLRILKTKKANYAAGVGDERRIRWDKGRFVVAGPVGEAGASKGEESASAYDEAFFTLLRKFTAEGTLVTSKGRKSDNYAPKLMLMRVRALKTMPGATVAKFEAAMSRLFDGERLANKAHGSPSAKTHRIVEAAK